jgi:hypothetical protein
MARTVLIQVALFLAPFAVYALVLLATKRDAREAEHWPTRTLLTLAIAGGVLVILGLIFFAHFGGFAPGGTYEPARYEDGKLIPGRIK